MEMKRCPKGHYYDASIHVECPYCSNTGTGSATLPLEGFMGAENTAKAGYDAGDSGKTMPLDAAFEKADPDDGRTVALIKEDTGIDPVVGWLVCIEGKEKGRDYRIHSDNNYIGRSDRMDICIRGDETISRENHAVISYDMQSNVYYFSPGDGRAIVRVNDMAVFQTVMLRPHDRITIGKTVFSFMPFCDDMFMW
ncbi:MAG TPA: hypothetical protein DCL38_02395 [Lachnospiraceae bacterium]|nr:hypothetical protein [Lachnospiraceae bacterium]